MKKITALLSSLILMIMIVLPMSASAISGSGYLSGPATVRAGDTINVTFSVNGSPIEGIEGNLSYNTSQLTLSKITQNIASPWVVEQQGNKIIAYDNQLSAPINSSSSIFTATFVVNSSIAAGTGISVSYSGTISDGTNDKGINATYSKSISTPTTAPTQRPTPPPTQGQTQGSTKAPTQGQTQVPTNPKTGNANLATMTIDGVTFSPAFKPSVTTYTASVDYDVEKLNITGKTEDPTSNVSIGSTKLNVGKNTIRIKVTAAGGATKTYTIVVTRAQDPNAPTTTEAKTTASKNTKLSALSVEGFVLSPAFDPDVKKYIVWLPYETESINIAGTALDAKSIVKVEGGDNLKAGEANKVKVICTAEDGSKQVYEIIAMRAPLNGVYGSDVSSVSSDDNAKSRTPVWLTILLCVIFLAVGFLIAFLIFRNKNNNGPDGGFYDDDPDDDLGPDDSEDDNGPKRPMFRGITIPRTLSTDKAPTSFANEDDLRDVPQNRPVPPAQPRPIFNNAPAGTVPTPQVPSQPRTIPTPAPAPAPTQRPVQTSNPFATQQPATPVQPKPSQAQPIDVAQQQAQSAPRVFRTAPTSNTNAPTSAPYSAMNESPRPTQPNATQSSSATPIDVSGMGLPYTPAGGTDIPKPQPMAEQPPKRTIPKNPFEVCADDD